MVRYDELHTTRRMTYRWSVMMSCTRLEGCGAGIVQYQYDVSGHLHATAGIPPTQTRVDLSVQLLVFSQSRYEWATPCNSVQLRATSDIPPIRTRAGTVWQPLVLPHPPIYMGRSRAHNLCGVHIRCARREWVPVYLF